MTSVTLLPSNATRLERAIEGAQARIGDVPTPLRDLWDPATCPLPLLPWLAWALSIDRWNPNWTEAQKRAEVARAIALQRVKGTRASVEAVIKSFDQLLEITEWWETATPGVPHTFEIDLPLGAGGGERSTAAFAEAIIADVIKVKPARSHFVLIQSLQVTGTIAVAGGAMTMGFVRLDTDAIHDASPDWDAWLQTEQGEPIQSEAGDLLRDIP